MNKILPTLCFVVFTLISCTENDIEPIQYDVPQSLAGDVPLHDYFEEYALAGGKVIAISKEIRSGLNMAKMVKVTAEMSKATERLEALKALRPEIEASLSEQQQKDFKKVVYVLDASVGQLTTNMNEMDPSEIAANEAIKNKQQSEIDSAMALREEAIARQKAEGTYVEPSSDPSSMNMPRYMTFIFPIFAIFAFVILAYFAVFKKIRNKVAEVGYVMNDAKDAVGKLKQKVKEGEAEGKTLTDEEKKGIEFLEKFINK